MTEPRTIHYFVLDALADWEAAYALALLNMPVGTPRHRFRVVTVAERRDPITTMAGLRIVPDTTLAELTPRSSALLVLPGAPSWETGGSQRALDKAAELLRHDTPIAAICGATWGLAHAGLLDNRRHTSNAPEYLASTGYRGAALYQRDRAVSDRNVITAGATGALEFARAIFLALDYYPTEVVEAWYQLYRTGEARYFFELTKLTSA